MALAASSAAGHPGRFWAERPVELCLPGGTRSDGGQVNTQETAHEGVRRPRCPGCGALGCERRGCWENRTRSGEAESAAEAMSGPPSAETGEVALLGEAV